LLGGPPRPFKGSARRAAGEALVDLLRAVSDKFPDPCSGDLTHARFRHKVGAGGFANDLSRLEAAVVGRDEDGAPKTSLGKPIPEFRRLQPAQCADAGVPCGIVAFVCN